MEPQKVYHLSVQRFKTIIDKAAPFALLLYFLVGILAYVNIFPGSARFFYSSTTSGVIVRAFSTALICLYSATYWFLHRKDFRFPWPWAVAMAVVLFANLMAMVFTKHEYYYLYISSLYGFLHSVEVTAGTKQLVTMYLSSISDFALGFCFLFLLPHAFKEKKQLLWLTLPMIVFMLFECGYSIIREFGKYITVLSSESEIWGGYNVTIGATFGDKQEFGCFLTVGFCCALVSSFIASELPLVWKRAVRIGSICCGAVFFFITFFTLCKTAIISNCLASLCLLIGLLYLAFKRNKKLGIGLVSGLGVLFLGVVLVLEIEPLHSQGALAKFYRLIDTLFLSRINNGVFSRFSLVNSFFSKLNPVSFLFGYSKGGVNAYMRAATVEGQSALHTGFVYFQGCYGLLGTLLYSLLFITVIRNTVLLIRKELVFGLIILGALICTVIFNLAENEVLIMSGSAAIFLFNVICVIFPMGYVKNEKKIV